MKLVIVRGKVVLMPTPRGLTVVSQDANNGLWITHEYKCGHCKDEKQVIEVGGKDHIPCPACQTTTWGEEWSS